MIGAAEVWSIAAQFRAAAAADAARAEAVANVRAALGEVYDPCSQAWQRPLSLVDLGLVREVDVDEAGHVSIRVSLTVPFCVAVATIMQAVERRVAELPGITAVSVHIDQTAPWSPELMTETGRRRLAEHRLADRTRDII
jgi:metal-sulfur cluster biosynthetic enzyme